MDSRGPREDMGGGWRQLEANEGSLRNKQPANNSSWTWSLQNGKEAGVCMMLTVVAYVWHFQGWPEASYPPRGNSKARVASLSQKTFCISTNGLGGNFGKEPRSNATILAWSEGTPARSVTCSLLCWTGGAARGGGKGTELLQGHEYPGWKSHAG